LESGEETVGVNYREGRLSDASAKSLLAETQAMAHALTHQTNGSHVIVLETTRDGKRVESSSGAGVLTEAEMYTFETRLLNGLMGRLDAQKAKRK